MGCVTAASPPEEKLSVYILGDVALMPTFTKEAIPLAAAAVAVPTTVAPVLTVMVTTLLPVGTVLPRES
jgi:hypothetical protein